MASSSLLVCNPRRRFLVFLSFKGEDTRKTFVSHLHKSLQESGIDTFIDDEKLERGASIKSKLFEAIEESKLSIVILSKNYAFSTWCLEELSKILECQRHFGQKVVPVFYNIDPSNVRNQQSSFAKAFFEHKEKFKHEMEKLQIWKEALFQVGSISGYDSRGRDESSLIKEITDAVSCEVLGMQNVASNLIGMGPITEKINELLKLSSNDVRMMGIWGMPGIGKTTIAEFVYETISSQFEACYFFSNVKDTCYKGDLKLLQKQLLSHFTKRSDIAVDTVLGGKQSISNTLSHRKVLIVLDDVDDSNQMEALVESCSWFGIGSRIIITTRDKQLLVQHQVEAIYEVQVLRHDNAFQLFINYAFKEKLLTLGFQRLSKQFVAYCKGLPLALKVLGCFMLGKTIPEWEDEIKKLQRIPNPSIQDLLESSFDGLSEDLQELFLEIACFFSGWEKTLVTKILVAYELFPTIGMRDLVDRSLIAVKTNSGKEVIHVHDLLQEMGKQIIRKQSKDPGMRSQLFDYEDVYDVFTRDEAADKVKGISLYLDGFNWSLKKIHVSSNAFARMSNLRFLSIIPSLAKGCELLHCKGLECLPSSLKYLGWHEYPLSRLPSNFDTGNLMILKIVWSPIKRLWKGTKCLGNLIILNLSYCQKLKKIPNLSGASKLEKLILLGCSKLVKIQGSLQYFNNLHEVDLRRCEKLKAIPMLPASLITLNLSSCVKIEKYPEISGRPTSLTTLTLDRTSIKELPSAIESLQKLESLSLSYCERLGSVSSKISKLKSLKQLCIQGCRIFASFPDILEPMPSLEELHLCGTAIKDLPSSIARLEGLRQLWLSDCKNLVSVRESEGYCSNLQSLPGSIINAESNVKFIKGLASTFTQLPSSCLSNLQELNFWGSNKLGVFSFLQRFSPFLRQVEYLLIGDCHLDSIPHEIGHLRNLRGLYISGNDFKSLPETIKHLSKLENLDVTCCKRLHSLPNLPSSLERLYATDCASLERLTTLPKSRACFQRCPRLREQYVAEVVRASILEKVHTLITLLKMDRALSSWDRVIMKLYEISYSGSEIPEWIEQRSEGYSVSFVLPAHVLSRPELAFAICVVIGFEELLNAQFSFSFKLDCSGHVTVGEEHFEFVTVWRSSIWVPVGTEMSDTVVVVLVKGPNGLQSGCSPITISFNFHPKLTLHPRISEEEKSRLEQMTRVKKCGVSVLSHWANPKKRRSSSSAKEAKKRRRLRTPQEEEEGLLLSQLSQKLEEILRIQS